jgi:membrane-bound metal-dependent hydrolase YbcI (DUF457 family)
MAQAGIHAMVGIAVGKWAPRRDWLVLGVVLGNLLPDADNLAVAVATLMKLPTAGLHRTFTHSLFTALAVAAVFYLVAWVVKQPRWGDLGLGLGAGILMHILLDLVVWFNGVEILWPLPSWINLWSGVTPPAWFEPLTLSAEFLFFALFFLWLETTARRQGVDQDYLPRLRVWIWLQGALFLIFTALAYSLPRVFVIPYGAFYLISLGLAIAVTIRMRAALAAMAVRPREGKIKASLSPR